MQQAVLGVLSTTVSTVPVQTIRKRDGTEAEFDQGLIRNAIRKAAAESNEPDAARIAGEVCGAVMGRIERVDHRHRELTVEDVQDMVEDALLAGGHVQIARDYIRYRHEHRQARTEKQEVLGRRVRLCDVSKRFDISCLRVLASRYLFRNDDGEIIETPRQLFERVALLMGIPDLIHDGKVALPDGGEDDGAEAQRRREEAVSYSDTADYFDGRLRVGRYALNRWHLRALVRAYADAAPRVSVPFKELLDMIKRGELDHVADKIDAYYDLMVGQKFMPNSPTLMNAGGRLGQLSACFVLGVGDSLVSIMKAATDATMIFQSGGGVGINYSDVRPEGDMVASTSGVASGPVSFMGIVNAITEVVKQGGKRRGANMGILEVWHPDIEGFIRAKQKPKVLENFNVSVGMWGDFWKCVVEDEKYHSRNPRTGEPAGETDARKLWDDIAMSAYMSAEPGLIFLDNCNKHNVFAKARGGPLRATNPCGEQSLYPYESCNLGSINVAGLLDGDGKFDWKGYVRAIRTTTRFLDAVVDANLYPIPEIAVAARESRRIGLGVMGVADLLYKLRIPYNSREGFALQAQLAEYLTYYSMDESVELARERGTFGLYDKTEYVDGRLPVAGAFEDGIGPEDSPLRGRTCDWKGLAARVREHGIRNVVTTTVAPTGTIAMIASCSNGMEPVFALSYEKHVAVGSFHYANHDLKAELEARGLYSEEAAERITEAGGSIRADADMPEDMRRVFVTAADIHWADHLMAQAVWQRWIANSISKTINMPSSTDINDVRAAYALAHELGLKGITVYRDGSRDKQVLHHGKSGGEVGNDQKVGGGRKAAAADNIRMCRVSDATRGVIEELRRGSDYVRDVLSYAFEADEKEDAGSDKQADESAEKDEGAAAPDGGRDCPSCGKQIVLSEGCSHCNHCGFSACSA